MVSETVSGYAASWSFYEGNASEFQSERWERIRKARTTLGIYTGILNADSFAKATLTMETFDGAVLPLSLSDHLDRVISDTTTDGRERGQIIGWDVLKKDFAYGQINTGDTRRVRMPRFHPGFLMDGQRPLVDFHTHPNGRFFSEEDIQRMLTKDDPAYMFLTGSKTGGYAFLMTDKFSTWNFEGYSSFSKQLYSPIFSERLISQRLMPYGVIAYRWNNDPNRFSQGVGFQLTKIR